MFRLADASQLAGIPVLVVDDNATNRRVLDGLLTGWGMRPSSVNSAAAAQEALIRERERGTPYPLIISDVHMPDTDGFSLVAALRRNSDWGSLRIILLTSANRNGDAARCRELGVQAYLTKPVRRADLLTTLLTVFGVRIAADGSKNIVPCEALLENHRRLRILLAEDNVVNQTVAARLIEKMGHTVEIAANGLKAISALENGEFDLVFMDVQMPEMDGLEATERIRAKEIATGKHQPIFAMTAHVMKGDKELCLNAGMDGYVTKPLSSAAIHDVLEKIERNVPQIAG
jgi:CheY-like chemotaxis protein